jgi:hypothetical protein
MRVPSRDLGVENLVAKSLVEGEARRSRSWSKQRLVEGEPHRGGVIRRTVMMGQAERMAMEPFP